MSSPTIYRVNHCELKIKGTELPVSAFRMTLEENGIPTITLAVDASILTGGSAIKRLTPTDYFKIYNIAQEACDNRYEGDFEFESEAFTGAGKGDKQNLKLTGWKCASSGCTRFTATGGLVFGITLKHPAYDLYRSASSLTDLSKAKLDGLAAKVEAGNNPIEGIVNAMKYYAREANTNIDDENINKLHQEYIKVTELIKEKFDAGGLKYPTLTCTPLNESVKKYIIRYMDYILTNNNPFKAITDTILPHWLLSAKPQFNDKLKVSPLEPWGKTQLSISVDHITDITFPATELEPIAGVYLSGTWLAGKAYSSLMPQDGSPAISTSCSAGYARLNDETEAVGSIIELHMPPWFEFAVINAQGASAYASDKAVNAGMKHNEPAQVPQVTKEDFINYKTDIQKLVDDLFTLQYKATVSMGFVMRLSLQYGGEDLLPGVVYDIVDDKGKTALKGYVVGVTHFVDVKGETATTTIEARYVRRPEATVQGTQEYKSKLYEGSTAPTQLVQEVVPTDTPAE